MSFGSCSQTTNYRPEIKGSRAMNLRKSQLIQDINLRPAARWKPVPALHGHSAKQAALRGTDFLALLHLMLSPRLQNATFQTQPLADCPVSVQSDKPCPSSHSLLDVQICLGKVSIVENVSLQDDLEARQCDVLIAPTRIFSGLPMSNGGLCRLPAIVQ